MCFWNSYNVQFPDIPLNSKLTPRTFHTEFDIYYKTGHGTGGKMSSSKCNVYFTETLVNSNTDCLVICMCSSWV